MKVLQDILEITEKAFPTPEIQEIEELVRRELKKPVAKVSDDDFETFWKAYPKRKGSNPKQEAKAKFIKACQEMPPKELILRARRFKEEVEEGTPFVPQTRTWLHQRCYTDYEPMKEIIKPPKNLYDFQGDFAAYKKYLKEFERKNDG